MSGLFTSDGAHLKHGDLTVERTLFFLFFCLFFHRESVGGAPVSTPAAEPKQKREYKDMEHEAHDVATASVPIETLGLTAEGELSACARARPLLPQRLLWLTILSLHQTSTTRTRSTLNTSPWRMSSLFCKLMELV